MSWRRGTARHHARTKPVAAMCARSCPKSAIFDRARSRSASPKITGMQGRAAEARQRTLERVQDLGFPVPPAHLPVLEDNEFPRSARGIDKVIQRALVLNVRINLAFGMPPESSRDWLTTNGLMGSLSPRESALVGGSARSGEQEKLQVEALGRWLGRFSWHRAWIIVPTAATSWRRSYPIFVLKSPPKLGVLEQSQVSALTTNC